MLGLVGGRLVDSDVNNNLLIQRERSQRTKNWFSRFWLEENWFDPFTNLYLFKKLIQVNFDHINFEFYWTCLPLRVLVVFNFLAMQNLEIQLMDFFKTLARASSLSKLVASRIRKLAKLIPWLGGIFPVNHFLKSRQKLPPPATKLGQKVCLNLKDP